MANSKEGFGKEMWKGLAGIAIVLGAIAVGAELLDNS